MLKNNNCSKCSGDLIFSPEDCALKCSNCGVIVPINNNKQIVYHNLLDRDVPAINQSEELRQARCNDCGAQIVINKFDILGKCPYCGAVVVETEKSNKTPLIDCVIPFQFGVEKAKEYFRIGIKNKFFIPNQFKKNSQKLEVMPRYVSCYVFNCDLVADYSCTLIFEDTKKDANGHSHTTTTTKRVSGKMPFDFYNKIFEANRNLTAGQFNAVNNYNFATAKSYDTDYLIGASAEYTDEQFIDVENQLNKFIRTNLENKIKRKYFADDVKDLTLNINYNKKEYVCCLMPIYLFSYEYKKKHYATLMNGQTGKLGGGVPRSGLKILFLILSILGLIGGIILLTLL